MMKKIIHFLLVSILFCNCKKEKTEATPDLIVQAMTNGQWGVTRLIQNGEDFTSSFLGYKFQFFSNKTVDAIKYGVKQRTGNWDGNATTMTISADFPAAPLPVSLLNGTWTITKNSLSYVEASQISGGNTKTLRLDKL